jgi:hypothetical protein
MLSLHRPAVLADKWFHLGLVPSKVAGAFSRGKGYSAAAIQWKTVKQLLFDLAEAHLQELERKGLLPKEKN